MARSKQIGIVVALAFLSSAFVLLATALASQYFYNAGDYYFEVDPVLLQFSQAPTLAFYDSFFPPLMMPLSLMLRALPVGLFLQLDLIGSSDNPIENLSSFRARYALGAGVLCFLGFATFFSTSLQKCWRQVKIKNVAYFFLFFLLAVANPLIVASVSWGHPEEFLMGALILGSALLLLEKKYTGAALLAGLALATKQPAVFFLPAALFFIPAGQRVRFMLVSSIVAALLILPSALLDFSEFARHNLLAATGQDWNIYRGIDFITALGLREYAALGKPMILLLSVALPLGMAFANQKDLRLATLSITSGQFSLLLPLIFLLRSALDIGNIVYYALPAGLLLFLIDYSLHSKNKSPSFSGWIKNSPFPMPLYAFLGSLYLSLVLYRGTDIEPEVRGYITLLLLLLPIAFVLYRLLRSRCGSGWMGTLGVFLIGALCLGGYALSADLEEGKRYGPIKNYPARNIQQALRQGKTAYWLGAKPGLGIELVYSGAPSSIVFNRYDPEGAEVAFFDYRGANSESSLEMTTYNRVVEKKFSCKSCLTIKKSSALGKTDYREEKSASLAWGKKSPSLNWEAYIQTPSGQMIYLENSNLPVSLEKILPLIRDTRS